MYYCPFSLDQLLFMSGKKWPLCPSGYAGNQVRHARVRQSLSGDSTCGSPDEAALYSGSQSSGPPEFTLFPQRPSVSYFAAVWGRVSWLLSSYEEAQPLLWESKRQCGTWLQKMADPFIGEISEEDTVVHWACQMLPAKLVGQHRRTTAPQTPKPTQGPAPHRDF